MSPKKVDREQWAYEVLWFTIAMTLSAGLHVLHWWLIWPVIGPWLIEPCPRVRPLGLCVVAVIGAWAGYREVRRQLDREAEKRELRRALWLLELEKPPSVQGVLDELSAHVEKLRSKKP